MEATDVVMTIYIPRMYGVGYVFDGMFDKKIINQCEKKIKEMEKEIKKHNQIYQKLQDQQKVCWLANRKVAYKLDTSKKINDYIVEIILEQDIVKMIEVQVNDRTLTPTHVNSSIHTIIPIQTVVQRMSSKYQFTMPREFNERNGCNARLPDFELIKREFRR
ncbi:uncharacterized protein LOC143070692 isoform X2 [Mytilus galloprovincialis]|uniref:uncharacterized protein LOC143070692 isoform X2 n=1 Tax=Mytilus galloprovincialis TaxID=29158 RepID=UPI003F7C4A87